MRDRPRRAAPARVAVVGLGQVARELHLPACSSLPEVVVVGACDPRPERREWARRAHGVTALYESAEALLEREKPDVVMIGTPPDSHRDLCRLALAHGAHVFCEKPFVATLAEADDVIAEAFRQGRALCVNNEYRFMPIYREARQHLARGEFGRAFLIQCWQQMLHPPAREDNWRAALARYTLFEFGTHPLDLVCFLFDALPRSITAHTLNPAGGAALDPVVQATLRFPGERLATLLFNRMSHGPTRYLEMRVDCERAALRISFGGAARASVEWTRAGGACARLSVVGGGETRVEKHGRSRVLVRQRREGRPAATAANLLRLLEGVAAGQPSVEPARHAREILRIVLAGYESAATGETVWLTRPA